MRRRRVPRGEPQFTYDNGRAKRASFYIDPGSASGDVTSFWFNEYRFIRVP